MKFSDLAALRATTIDPTAHSITDRTFDCLPKGIVTENLYQILTHTPWQDTVTGVRPGPRVVVTRHPTTHNLDGVEPPSWVTDSIKDGVDTWLNQTPCDVQNWLTRNKDMYRFFLTEFLAMSSSELYDDLATVIRAHDDIMERMLETSGCVDLSLLDSAALAPLKEEFDRCSQDVISTITSLTNSDEATAYYRVIAIAHDVICFMQFPDRIPDNALHHGVIAHAPSFMLVRAENAVSSSIAARLPTVAPTGPPDSEELRNLQRQIQELQSRLAAASNYNPDF